MEYKWLNKGIVPNNKIIIFFNGWGMDDSIVKHLNVGNFDILMFYDYNSLKTDFLFETLENYKERYLISWSMGVMVGSIFAKKLLPITKSVAINGTLLPINSDYGIHPKIYDLTIKGFNEQGKEKFIKSMFDTEDLQNEQININRSLENQHRELIALKVYLADKDFHYDKAIISDSDKIIPTKSQVAYWNAEPNFKSGHCPFFKIKKWSDLL